MATGVNWVFQIFLCPTAKFRSFLEFSSDVLIETLLRPYFSNTGLSNIGGEFTDR